MYQCDTGLLSKTGGRPQVSWCRINHRFCLTAAISISRHILYTWCCVGITGYTTLLHWPATSQLVPDKSPVLFDSCDIYLSAHPLHLVLCRYYRLYNLVTLAGYKSAGAGCDINLSTHPLHLVLCRYYRLYNLVTLAGYKSAAAISISRHILYTWCCVGITGYTTLLHWPATSQLVPGKSPVLFDSCDINLSTHPLHLVLCRYYRLYNLVTLAGYKSAAAISISRHILYTWCCVGITGYTTLLHWPATSQLVPSKSPVLFDSCDIYLSAHPLHLVLCRYYRLYNLVTFIGSLNRFTNKVVAISSIPFKSNQVVRKKSSVLDRHSFGGLITYIEIKVMERRKLCTFSV
ncbi:hypothetical protein J6590_050733 [Homalodisca vitripennis]|nr:hypothetical protein J6590_050733 [Homalodisca vitripennis]